MKNVMTGTKTPYLFHFNWNLDKETKRQFMEQMGAWHVDETKCPMVDSPTVSKCCLAQATPVCYFGDKPSILTECKTFPFLESNTSFW